MPVTDWWVNVITPLSKDLDDLVDTETYSYKNYRPVSNLVLSKLIERCVATSRIDLQKETNELNSKYAYCCL